MKQLLIYIAIAVSALAIGCNSAKVSESESKRDLTFEKYCDSIWENNPDYYVDVLMEDEEYIDYIETHGEWWQ